MSAQVTQPLENAFIYKNLLFFINNQSLHNEAMSTYLNTTFGYLPKENDGRTTVVNGKELYYLGLTDTVFVFYSIDGKYIESTISLLNTLSEYIALIIKKRYTTPVLANFISIKLCCYLPSDKSVPFGFVKHSDNNSADLFGVPLLSSNLTLYTKTFEFNEQYELKTITFQHLVDYSDIIQKFVQKNVSTIQPSIQPSIQHSMQPSIQPSIQHSMQPSIQPSIFTSNPMQISASALSSTHAQPSSTFTSLPSGQQTFIGFQTPYSQYQYGKR
jgi:hypothetical protein